MDRILKQFDHMSAALLPTVGELMHQSVVYGSPITGAPGQAEQDGDLIASWRTTVTETSASTLSNSEYAIPNEYGVRRGGKPYIQRSAKGGRYSVGITRKNFQKIIDHAGRILFREAA